MTEHYNYVNNATVVTVFLVFIRVKIRLFFFSLSVKKVVY